ncbi:DNA-binding response regulator [Paenibacillus segetis]|uniref:DNA-binding response regulator n=1 Tax=Paenibacillus segetis TaxID=1325360 RepID=A0ABQ1YMV1_9BACL|nr:response regulator transcription factor [Paenibacillus segetis]GGH32056.1 DNA-binding response regulator [Paenibacillus segetis]
MKIRVLIADDNSFVREGMKIILSTFEEFEVLTTVDDGRAAVEYCKEHEVDVALLDVRMPNMNGVEATRLLTEETKTKPLILTTFDDDEYILDAIRFGAKGYLLKNNDPERIRDAIKSIHSGNNVLQDVVLDKLKSSMAGMTPSKEGTTHEEISSVGNTSAPLTGVKGVKSEHTEYPFDCSLFTSRELEVMSGIAKGLSNKEISKELFISEGTTANYITSILNKTALQHRTQIAIYYLTGKIH